MFKLHKNSLKIAMSKRYEIFLLCGNLIVSVINFINIRRNITKFNGKLIAQIKAETEQNLNSNYLNNISFKSCLQNDKFYLVFVDNLLMDYIGKQNISLMLT